VREAQAAHAEFNQILNQLQELQAQATQAARSAEGPQALRADIQRLQEELQNAHAQREAAESAQQEHLGQLQREMEAIRAERDQLQAERQALALLKERSEAQVLELQRALMDATALHEAERQRYAHQEQQQLTCLHAEEQRFREEQARGTAERQRWQEERAEERRRFEQERASSEREIEHWRQKATALEKERDCFAAQRDKAEAAHHEDNAQWQAEVAQLRQTVAESQEQRAGADQRYQETAKQIQALEAELSQQREQKAKFQRELEAARAEATAERCQFELKRAALEEEVERGRREAVALGQERDRFAAQRDKAEAARLKDKDRWQVEVARLRQTLAESQEQRDGANRRCQEAAARIQALEVELARQPEQKAKLQRELEAARAEATAERRQFEQSRAALQGEIERGRREATAFKQERDRLAVQRDKAAAARHEDNAQWQAEVARLRQALAESQEQRNGVDRRYQDAADRIQTLEVELAQQREQGAGPNERLPKDREPMKASGKQWPDLAVVSVPRHVEHPKKFSLLKRIVLLVVVFVASFGLTSWAWPSLRDFLHAWLGGR
jgi:chromosome segregation ATPase